MVIRKSTLCAHYFLVLAIMSLLACEKDIEEAEVEQSFMEKLTSLPGIAIDEIEVETGYKMAFRILITQPLNHDDADGVSFTQELFLKHRDEKLPMVFDPRGYGLNEEGINSLTDLFPSNYLGVEHRFFTESRPQPLEWEYLTIKQAAEDHHRIVDLFDDIYQGKWVSTGSSKGGMTALFHKRFYPDDVDATVAFVAPLLTGLPDRRFDEFLTNQVGDPACRKAIEEFQKNVLNRRDAMLNLYREHEVAKEFNYSIGLEKVLELTVLEYQFSFWQYGWSSCDQIPNKDASDLEVFQHLIQVSPAWYYDDFAVDYFHPLFYQAYTEIGYYYFVDDHLNGLIKAVNAPNHRDLAPDVSMTYNPSVMQDIISWLHTSGNDIIYIYGADDPYTAAAIPQPTKTNALRIIQPGTNHSVKFEDLGDKDLVYSTLEDWLEVQIE